jgi:glyoxylase-like metal-dependent hydrolase (beta-lactamase superfamily II)
VRPFHVHEYNADLLIVRQAGCTNFEKPFIYLLFGREKALLIDTGATGADVSIVVREILAARKNRASTNLVVIHSHGHGDHTAGDAPLKAMAGVTFVEATVPVLQQFFGIKAWPTEIVSYDLGDRVVDVVPIPGHQPASIAVYDRRTGILFTGDTVYPGRLYVRDAAAFRESIERLVTFTKSRPVSHVLGAHIENMSTPYLDYPEGTKYQPEEHALELGRAHILELRDGLEAMQGKIERRRFRDFTIWPVEPR